MIHQIDGLGGGGAPAQSSPLLSGSALFASVFSGARGFASALFTTILFLYFLLLAGDIFLRRLVEILPRFSAKRQAVDISLQIEDDIFAYLSTITVMNLLVGLATAATMQVTGVGDPILWGVVAFLLNFAPIIGPIIAIFIFLLAGLLTIDNEWRALAPAASYLVIHLIEGETLTPMLLAKRFTINPLLVVAVIGFLVVDVGNAGRDSLGADAGHPENRLRSRPAFRRARPYPGKLNFSGPCGGNGTIGAHRHYFGEPEIFHASATTKPSSRRRRIVRLNRGDPLCPLAQFCSSSSFSRFSAPCRVGPTAPAGAIIRAAASD